MSRTDWRKPEEPKQPSLLGRFPAVGVALAVLLALTAVAAFILAARAGDSDGEGPPAAATGGSLRVGVVGLDSLDPADARDPTAVMVVDQLFDTLIAYDPEDLRTRPGLAATWEPNADQTAFTFKLAEGATFHDGSPVTSADVKFTLERIARQGSESPLLSQLTHVSGYGPYHNDGTAPDLVGVEAPDPATVVIRLDQPFSTFPAVLGHPGFGIVPKAKVEALGDQFKTEPVGSGPFALASSTDESVQLAPAQGRKGRAAAKLDEIVFVRFEDAEDAYASFTDGRIHVAPVPPTKVDEATRRFGTRGIHPFLGIVFYAMNLKSPDLADVRLRQAISLAIDREGIVADVYRGSVAVASGLVAEGVPERVDDACGDRCAHDPERAKVLLSQAFPGGRIPEVAIDHDDDPTQAAVAASIKADLDAVGIPAGLRPHPFAEYGQFLVSGEQELFRLGWIADYPSADAFLEPLFSSTSPENVTGLASAEVDNGLQAARAEPDAGRRRTLYRDVEQQVLDQFVVVPVAQLEIRMVVAEAVGSFALNPLGSFDGAAVTLAAE